MDWPTDTLAGIYLSLFAFGLIFSVASLLLGAAHGHAHLPGGHHLGHLGHAGHAGHGAHAGDAGHAGHASHGAQGGQPGQPGTGATGHHDLGVPGPSPLNISTAMIFVTWFGAAGYILRAYYGSLAGVSFLVATVAGLAGAWLVYLFLVKVLWGHQTELDPANYQIVGTLGRLSSPIRAGGTGEIVYSLDGKQCVDGARSADGSTLPLGAEVVIARYEGGLAYVEPLATWRARDALAPGEPFIGEPIEPIEPLDHPPPGRRRG
jgi:membrane protein implicated in regulation of membrane protease activity